MGWEETCEAFPPCPNYFIQAPRHGVRPPTLKVDPLPYFYCLEISSGFPVSVYFIILLGTPQSHQAGKNNTHASYNSFSNSF